MNLAGPCREMNASRGSRPLRDELLFRSSRHIVDNSRPVATDRDAAAGRVATQRDDRAGVRDALHEPSVLRGARPRECKREQSRMAGRGLESESIPAVQVRELVANDCLRWSAPRFDALVVHAGDRRRRMEVQISAELRKRDA